MKRINFCIVFLVLFSLAFTSIAQQSVTEIAAMPLFTLMRLDSNDNPVLTYFNTSTGTLDFTRCDDIDCSGDVTTVTIVEPGGTTIPFELMLDAKGNAHILYSAREDGVVLKLASCSDINCESFSVITFDEIGFSGSGAAYLDDEDQLFLVYFNDNTQLYYLITCEMSDCQDFEAIELLEEIGGSPSIDIQLDSQGNPMIALQQNISTQLSLLHCTDPLCSEGIVTPVDNEGTGAISFAEMVLTSEGLPIFAYYSQFDAGVRIAFCADEFCSEVTRIKLGDMTTGSDVSLNIDSNDHPVIVYLEGSPGDAFLVSCNDIQCEDSNSESLGYRAQFLSSALRQDDTAIVAIGSFTQGDQGLRIIQCATLRCEE